MHRKKVILSILLLAGLAAVLALLYRFNVIPHPSYDSADFGLEPYVSPSDADLDGVDDQTDLLKSARAYLATKPAYQSRYYEGGYPDDGCGVCTDVVAQAMLGAGYDLMELVSEDIALHPADYDIDEPDPNIDFRRVRNLAVYFQHTATALTTDLEEIDQWQGGDIVIFRSHIGIVSDRRNANGVPFLLHHASPFQLRYEEDVLENRDDIVGHYRIS